MEHSWGENKYPNELPCPRGIAPLCTISNLSHMGWGEIWLILYWIIFLHSFISTGRTDKLFDHKALLSAKSHFRVVMANDLASWLREKSGSQHVFEARNAKDIVEDWAKHYALKSERWREGAYTEHIELLMILYAGYHQCQWNIYAAKRAHGLKFRLTQTPRTSFLSLQMLMQNRSRTKTTKAGNHFFWCLFHLFFFSK